MIDTGSYYHKKFLRGEKNLTLTMTRQKIKVAAAAARQECAGAQQHQTDPDFNASSAAVNNVLSSIYYRSSTRRTTTPEAAVEQPYSCSTRTSNRGVACCNDDSLQSLTTSLAAAGLSSRQEQLSKSHPNKQEELDQRSTLEWVTDNFMYQCKGSFVPTTQPLNFSFLMSPADDEDRTTAMTLIELEPRPFHFSTKLVADDTRVVLLQQQGGTEDNIFVDGEGFFTVKP